MKDLIKQRLEEALILQTDREGDRLIVLSNETDVKKASQETFKNRETLGKNGFKWDGNIRAWYTPLANFESARSILNKINKNTDIIDKLESLAEYVKQTENFEGKGNLMDRLTTYVSDLANATDEKAVSAEIRRYLTFFAGFRGYSAYNTMLIFIQRPTATKVAGYNMWKAKFRRVKAGAKGIMIFVPRFGKKGEQPSDKGLDKEVEKGQLMGFMPGYVFDIADTEPIDDRGEVPTAPKWFDEIDPTERTRELYSYVREVAENMGIEVTQNGSRHGERGYSAGNHINMSSTVEGAGEVSTLVHELAHELMHKKSGSIYYQGEEVRNDSAIKELQAESVAYVVMKHYGLPVEHQPTYIAMWKGGKDKILSNLKVISDVAKFIIEEIEKVASYKSQEAQPAV